MSDMLNYYYGQGRLYGALRDELGLPVAWRWMGDVSQLALAIKSDTRSRQCSNGGTLAVDDIHIVSQQVALDATFMEHSPENIALLVHGQRWSYGEKEERIVLRKGIQAGDRVSLPHQTVWDVMVYGFTKGVDYEVDPLWGAITFLITPGWGPLVTYFHTEGYHIPLMTTVPTTLALRYEGLNLAEQYSYSLLDLYRARFNPADLLSLINQGNTLASLTTTADVLFDAARNVDPQFGRFGRLTYTKAFGARINLAVGTMGYFDTVVPVSGKVWANLLSMVVSGLEVTVTATRSTGEVVISRALTDSTGRYVLQTALRPGNWTLVATAVVMAPDGSELPVTSNIASVSINTSGVSLKMKIYNPASFLFYVKDATEDFTIDYGDGVDSHDYRIEGGYVYSTRALVTGVTYELNISGSDTCVFGLIVGSSRVVFPNKVIELISIKGLRKSLNMMFIDCNEMTTIRAGAFDYLSEASDFTSTFHTCSKLLTIPAGLFAKTPSVTTFQSTFYACSALTEIPAGLFDNTPKVVTFASTYQSCSKITTLPSGLFKYTPLVSSMAQTFYDCSNIVAIPAGLLDSLTQLTALDYTFSQLQKITTVPAGLFAKNTKLLSVMATFNRCSSLMSLPAGLFDTLTGVRTLEATFQYCAKLEAIPVGLLDNNIALTSVSNLFSGCTALKAIPAKLLDNNTKLTNISNLFSGCSTLTAIPSGLFDKTPLVNNAIQLFNSCSRLQSIPAGLFDSMPLITSLMYMFSSCSALTAIPTGLFNKTNKVISISAIFNSCSALTDIPNGLFDAMPLVSDASNAFSNCLALKTIPANLFAKLPLVTSFSGVFNTCYNLTAIPVGLFDNNIQATNFTWAFTYCRAITRAPAGLLNKTKATTLGYLAVITPQRDYRSMFSGCTAFEVSLDDLFDAASYPLMKEVQGLFFECPKLTGSGLAFIAKLTQITDVSKYQGAFFGCTSLSDYDQLPALWRTR